ncbi:AASS [Mytilus edulis]|uniref:AASS n=1 Tax=Mytilus edulis TaxID=6550 RepID=A0A8S3PRE3_MYTED|nr:AASS [Mytilus edulis]
MWRTQSQPLCKQILKQNGCLFTRRAMSSGLPGVLAIRRETINVWERRAPLAPKHVRKLVKDGIKVIVQPSNRRAYNMQEYAKVGATIQEDMSEASLVMGVKSVPIDLLLPDKTYAFFSHTIKAQEANMPLLDAIMERNIRLIDYERMVDEKGQRTVAFGVYAGVAGMINILHGLGLRLLALGHHTPFMYIGPSHNYRNTEQARQAIRDAGYEIALERMPKSLGPLVFVFTGSGNVSQGAQQVFQEFPHEYIEPEHLPKVAKHGATNKLYICVVSREDHYIHKDGGKFDPEEFEQHPSRYGSTFASKIAPYASVIINGIYWAPTAPRLITIPEAKSLLTTQSFPWIPSSSGCPQLPHRLIALCDISADPGGSIEFMNECTTIDKPFCLYDADQNKETDSFAGKGVLICSIDNMPAQIPKEATDFFGHLLFPKVKEMLKSDAIKPYEDFDTTPEIKNAVIASNGVLTPNHQYIQELRNKFTSSHKSKKTSPEQKKILILGSGYVSSTVIEYLNRNKDFIVTVASKFKAELDNLSKQYPQNEMLLLDVSRKNEEFEHLIQEHDIVISLLPGPLHPEVAKLCIKHKRNMVTASYVSPEMQHLHQDAVDAGITILNEIGVDPGIDHMLAMECFDDVRSSGGKITSYISWCGGLPAPEHSDSPLMYKFSWFPIGVLKNCLAGATYLKDGKKIEIPSGGLLDAPEDLTFLPGFNLEGIPNRDSTKYTSLYGIESAKTMLRGTIRYKGFCDVIQGLVDLNLLSSDENSALHPKGPDMTWKSYVCDVMGKSPDTFYDSVKDMVFERVGHSEKKLQTIIDLGLLDDQVIDKKGTPIDTLCHYLAKKLAYEPNERDMILMHHNIGVEWPDGTTQRRTVGLTVYGDYHGYSAMAKTVGYPTAIGTEMILNGRVKTSEMKGVQLPMSKDVYKPILERLKAEGIKATEKIHTL